MRSAIKTLVSLSFLVLCTLSQHTYSSSGRWVDVSDVSLSWSSANSYCISNFNGYLATITSSSDNNELAATITGTISKWMGYYDPHETNNASKWEWVDGSSVTFTQWSVGLSEPDEDDFCALVSPNTYWYGAMCYHTRGFVCNVGGYPTQSPSNTPSNQPSDAPSNTPSDTPSNAPSSTPSIPPSSTPSSMPSSTPSNVPTIAPTNLPTVTPVKNENTENSSTTLFGLSENIIIVLICAMTFLIMCCMVLIFLYYREKHKSKAKQREIELNNITGISRIGSHSAIPEKNINIENVANMQVQNIKNNAQKELNGEINLKYVTNYTIDYNNDNSDKNINIAQVATNDMDYNYNQKASNASNVGLHLEIELEPDSPNEININGDGGEQDRDGEQDGSEADGGEQLQGDSEGNGEVNGGGVNGEVNGDEGFVAEIEDANSKNQIVASIH